MGVMDDHDWMTGGQLVALTGGAWDPAPPPGWNPSGIHISRFPSRPRRVIVARDTRIKHGIPTETAQLDAAQGGDCALLLARDAPRPAWNGPILRVEHPRRAVAALARYARGRYGGTVIAVTGSVGKSSTNAMLAAALEGLGASCYHSDYKRNTHDGVMAQLCNLRDASFAAMEVSASPRRVGSILRPHVSILTALSPSHLTYLRDLDTIAEIKSDLFRTLVPGGCAVICRDIPLFEQVAATAHAHAERVVTYGLHPGADIRLSGFEAGTVRADAFGESLSWPLAFPGRHQAVNSLAVVAATHALGLDWRRAGALCGGARFPDGRGQHFALRMDDRAITVLDDSGNANPLSMAAALRTLGETTPERSGRRVAVLADMLELADQTGPLHAALAAAIDAAGVDALYLCGDAMRSHLAPAVAGTRPMAVIDSLRELRPHLTAELRDGDVVLFKASYGTGLHRVVRRLCEQAGA